MGEIIQSVLVNGVRVKALIDSGATDSHLSKRVADKVRLYLKGSRTFSVADGRKYHGRIGHITVKIFNRLGSCEVIVSEILPQDSIDLILGQNFLQDNEIELDFDKDMMRYKKHQPIVKRIGRL